MKIKQTVSKILNSKWTLNIIAILSLFNIIGYLIMGNLNNVLYFIVFAGLTYYFSKNMVIVLGIPLILVNLLQLKKNREGFNTSKSNSDSKTSDSKSSDSKSSDSKSTSSNKPESKTKQGLPMHPISDIKKEEEQQGFESGVRKGGNHQIDYATTVEEAYDNLNNILGGDGIKKLTSDSQHLMKQQMQLAEAMKGMAPVLQSIAPMVENLKGMMGNNGEAGGLGNIMDMANKLAAKK